MLHLNFNSIGIGTDVMPEAGLRKLGEALLRNTALTILYLGANHIGDKGAEILADVYSRLGLD